MTIHFDDDPRLRKIYEDMWKNLADKKVVGLSKTSCGFWWIRKGEVTKSFGWDIYVYSKGYDKSFVLLKFLKENYPEVFL